MSEDRKEGYKKVLQNELNRTSEFAKDESGKYNAVKFFSILACDKKFILAVKREIRENKLTPADLYNTVIDETTNFIKSNRENFTDEGILSEIPFMFHRKIVDFAKISKKKDRVFDPATLS